MVDPDAFGLTCDERAAALGAENIDTRKYYDPPVHRQTAYRRYADGRPLPNTEWLAADSLSLPIWPNMENSTAPGVCRAVSRLYGVVTGCTQGTEVEIAEALRMCRRGPTLIERVRGSGHLTGRWAKPQNSPWSVPSSFRKGRAFMSTAIFHIRMRYDSGHQQLHGITKYFRKAVSITPDIYLRALADAVMVNAALVLALALRYLWIVGVEDMVARRHEILLDHTRIFLVCSLPLTLVALAAFCHNGLYTRGRAYQGRYKALIITQAVSYVYLIFGLAVLVVRAVSFPRSVIFLSWGLTLVMLVGARLWSRLWADMIRMHEPTSPRGPEGPASLGYRRRRVHWLGVAAQAPGHRL